MNTRTRTRWLIFGLVGLDMALGLCLCFSLLAFVAACFFVYLLVLILSGLKFSLEPLPSPLLSFFHVIAVFCCVIVKGLYPFLLPDDFSLLFR